jgi:cobalt-zinc-cadmium resistance protein CzcA
MLRRLIDFHLDNPWMVIIGVALLVLAGSWTLSRIPIDAFPDLTNNQVLIIAQAAGFPPAEVEQLVTYPIETAVMGLPRTLEVRSISKLGLALVTVVFEDGVNTYLARQWVNERMAEVRARLPLGVEPQLGPVATAFGEVYQYTLEAPGWSATDLKTLQDWQIRNQLRAVRGVNEVNTWGGQSLQVEVVADPVRLRRYGLTLRDLMARLRENNENFGGGYIEHASELYTVRGLGRASRPADLENIVVLARAGTPVLLKDVAEVRAGALQRYGATTRDARGETVSGMVIMLKGENGKRVIERVKEKVAGLRLPEGVRLKPFYDQSMVIDATIATVRRNLLEGGALVIAVLLLFLGHLRAAIVVAAVIPLSMLFGFLGMAFYGISANLMSLGAVDFGMIVDGAVVMMENAVRRRGGGDAREAVRAAAHEVARPITFGVGIIIAVYLPVLLLEGLEGRMFRPMAITVCAALLGSLWLALTFVPAAAVAVLRRAQAGNEHGGGWFERLRSPYRRALEALLRRRVPVVAAAAVLVAAAVGSVAFIGTEFMPRLDEGSILITTKKLPGVALTDSVALSTEVEKAVRRVPEVTGVVTKLGRPDLATEAMGVYESDSYVALKPREQWRFRTKDELIAALETEVKQIPGLAVSFSQPMAMRLDEVISGVKADVALKIFGDDAATLEALGERALRVLAAVPGAADVQMERATGAAEARIEVDRRELARYGLNIADLRDVLAAAVPGYHVSDYIDGQRRFPVAVRLPDRYRADPDVLGEILLDAPGGERVPLARVARIVPARAAEVISREFGQRRLVVQANVRGTDLGSFVAAAQAEVEKKVPRPPGYSYVWGGQFENQQRALRRLTIVIPLSIAIIFGFLYATFRSARRSLLILLNVPFALVGGIVTLWARGINLNLSASVGFIALFGVAVLNGVVLVAAIDQLRARGAELRAAVLAGAATRLRPVLMTALVAALGLLPMALATTPGAEVQRPLASVVIGGLGTSTLLTLFLLPVLYPWFAGRAPAAAATPDT